MSTKLVFALNSEWDFWGGKRALCTGETNLRMFIAVIDESGSFVYIFY